jgi:hypothetical protein
MDWFAQFVFFFLWWNRPYQIQWCKFWTNTSVTPKSYTQSSESGTVVHKTAEALLQRSRALAVSQQACSRGLRGNAYRRVYTGTRKTDTRAFKAAAPYPVNRHVCENFRLAARKWNLLSQTEDSVRPSSGCCSGSEIAANSAHNGLNSDPSTRSAEETATDFILHEEAVEAYRVVSC